MNCGCLVSVVYLTSMPLFKPLADQMAVNEMIEVGNAVVTAADKLGESHIRELRARSIAEVRSEI